jgi:putative FmdB family regulatory protein
MPLYEYQCSKCGAVFERLQKFSDAPLTEHEGCGGAVERLISAPAFHLKGTGWYATDYARGSGGAKGEIKHDKPGEGDSSSKSEGKSNEKSESKSENKSESSSESKTESKSESKTESKPAPAGAKHD